MAPSPSLPNLLRQATEAEKVARDAHTYLAWGAPLTLDGYLAREQRLRSHPWARAGMQTWLLVDSTDAVLSSCETFRSESVQTRGPTQVGGHTYAVASVFTEPRLRGNGHAGRMMSALAEALCRQDPRAQAITLYSDVGTALYAREGFVDRPAVDWTFSPLPKGPPLSLDAWLRDRDLNEALPPLGEGRGGFRQRITAEQLDWHLERERIYSEQLSRPRPEACGARVGSSSAVWCCHFPSQELLLLILEAQARPERAALLNAARRTASRAGLCRVRLWEPPGLTRDEAAERSPRKGSVPMVKALSGRMDPSSWEDIPRALWV